jgi:hypothetical protein
VTEHGHQETEGRAGDASDFWLQIESGPHNGPLWERDLSLSTSGNIANGTLLTTLLFAYIGYHDRLLANHQRVPTGAGTPSLSNEAARSRETENGAQSTR